MISDPEQTEEKEWQSVGSMTGDACLISAAVGTRGPTEILISGKPDTFITTSIASETQKDRRTASRPSISDDKKVLRQIRRRNGLDGV